MSALRKFGTLILTILREIFDENAYARFLVRESRESSAKAYSDFIQEKHSAPVRRCC
jgi:hypothetical protein